jgi:hypothetical protein
MYLTKDTIAETELDRREFILVLQWPFGADHVPGIPPKIQYDASCLSTN